MRYELDRRLVSKRKELPISEEEYNRILFAKEQLRLCYKLVENYSVVVESYRAFEIAKFELELDHMLFRKHEYTELANGHIKMNTPITGLLSAFRYFIDSTPQILASVGDKTLLDNFKEKTRQVYDSTFEYRFIEALRNYSQHHALPIHSFSVHRSWDRIDPQTSELANSISLEVWKEKLKRTGDFKKRILDEMPEKVNLVYAIRAYLAKLSELYEYAQKMTDQSATTARTVIEEVKSNYTKVTGLPHSGLCAFVFDDDLLIAQEDVFTDWDDARLNLIEKTILLKSLHRWYITGKIRKQAAE